MQAEIAAALAAAPLADIADDLVARVPVRVAHNDAKLDNMLFRAGAAVCLVDLDTIMPTAWFWDAGDLLRTASTAVAEDDPRADTAVVDPERYRAVIDGYCSGLASATSPERAEVDAFEHAGAIVTYEQALRFLTDWIAGDVYYGTTRPGQNLDRARNQLAPARVDAGYGRRVTGLPRLERSSLPAILELCRRGIRNPTGVDALTLEELEGALFAPEQPAVIRGDPAVGVVATVEWEARRVRPPARGRSRRTRARSRS